jgi:thiamine biosynthesis lipoprotein
MFQSLQAALRRHLPRQFMRTLGFDDTLPAGPSASGAGCWWHHDDVAMGTSISLDLWAEDRDHAAQAATAVMRVMNRIDQTMSPHRTDSELSRLNREAARAPVVVSEELFTVLQRALRLSAFTDGAFDITYAAAGHLYDFRAGVMPDEQALRAALPGIGWRHLALDEGQRSVRFTHPDTRIDLGGFAKGHAVDQAAAWLQRLGVEHAYLSAGGDSRVIGDRRGRPWSLGIRDPRAAHEIIAVLPLEDIAVSTSGDYERCFVRDGQRIHHLIDPRTGRPADAAASVTVLAEDGVTAEALSKLLFVRGADEGFERIAQLPGVDAMVVTADGSWRATPGLSLAHAGELGRPVDRSMPTVQ